MGLIDGMKLQHRRMIASVLLLITMMLLVVNFWKFPPPQIGADKEVFRTVDALFTAITSHSQKQLDECEGRLLVYQQAGTLQKQTADFLNLVIRDARSGKWQPAAERLYEFMYGQRRR